MVEVVGATGFAVAVVCVVGVVVEAGTCEVADEFGTALLIAEDEIWSALALDCADEVAAEIPAAESEACWVIEVVAVR